MSKTPAERRRKRGRAHGGESPPPRRRRRPRLVRNRAPASNMTDKPASGGRRGRRRTPDAGRTDGGGPNMGRAGEKGPGNRGPGPGTGEKPSQVCGPRAAAAGRARGARTRGGSGGGKRGKKITRRRLDGCAQMLPMSHAAADTRVRAPRVPPPHTRPRREAIERDATVSRANTRSAANIGSISYGEWRWGGGAPTWPYLPLFALIFFLSNFVVFRLPFNNPRWFSRGFRTKRRSKRY